MEPVPPPDRPTRRGLARVLWRLADLVQAADRRRSFRARAFRSAVWSLDALSVELGEPPDEMAKVEGIGPGIVRLIEEYRDTGTVAEFDRLRPRFPDEVARIRRLPRITPGRLEEMKRGLGIDTVADLLAAIDTGAILTVEGIGPATIDRWAAILALPPARGAMPAHQAAVSAGRLRSHLAGHLGDDVRVLGEVRRLEEWVRRLDLLVITQDPERVVYFLEYSAAVASSAVEPGWAIDVVTHDHLPGTVRLSNREEAGTAVVRWTGPTEHVQALDLENHEPYSSEAEVYEAAGSGWIPPPARRADLSGAEKVVGLEEVVGDLHVHTDWSPDGHLDLDQVVEVARERGYQYLAVTDHTLGLRFGGLDAQALRRQRRLVKEARERHPDLRILHGAEVNIDREGVPDLDDDTLRWLDLVVAGCHSNFDLPLAEQTARVVAAVRHPAVKVLSHPTGRRIGIRPAFRLDLDAVLAAAAEEGTALEINGHRDRMDLSAEHAARAAAAGVPLLVNSDAHRLGEFDNLAVALGVAQRAGLGAESLINTRETKEFMAWVDS